MSFLDSFSSALPKEISLEYLKQFVPVEWWDEKPEWAAVSALCRCGKFDVQDYLKRYPDVEQTDIDPVLHFVRHGIKENRYFNCMPDTDFGGSKVNLAYKAFKNGEYEKALKMYEELGERIGIENFAANIAICKKKLNIIDDISFSIILPTYNRDYIIEKSIESVFSQTYKNYELIIIDDGSNDNTEDIVNNKYGSNHKIKYKKLNKNKGASYARNRGIEIAKYDWIAYIDSDNTININFLYTFYKAILNNPTFKCFYSNFLKLPENKIIGEKFCRNKLETKNYIDLGVFVHRKELYYELGGFDEKMDRLVDYDLILRYTKKYIPYHVDSCLMKYDNNYNINRITNSKEYKLNYNYLQKKNKNIPTVTTIISTYNHEDFVAHALESALFQTGNFIHEIIISDDGSKDKTHDIVKKYTNKYKLIIDLSHNTNLGISENLKKCIAKASGKYIFILEGDDYWISPLKIKKHIEFLDKNDDCSMSFNSLYIYNNETLTVTTSSKHKDLKNKLDGKDLILTDGPIINFSTCCYRSEILKNIPEILYEGRLSEYSLSFHFENYGKIGFLNEKFTVYRNHRNSVWFGSDKKSKLLQAIQIRETTKKVCRSVYIDDIDSILRKKIKEYKIQQ